MSEYEFQINIGSRPRARARRRRGEQLPPIQRMLVLAHQVDQVIANGHITTRAEIAQHLGISRGRLTQVLWFLKLSPEIQAMIVLGKPASILQLSERQLQKVMRNSDPKLQMKQLNSLLNAY